MGADDVYTGIFAIGWQTYLSFINQKASVEEKAERAERAHRTSMVTAEDHKSLDRAKV
jgi:hypothetical protein